ncbi:hypothetical protein QT970_31030 [Microcoleus sp. herbarium8]|uniref:hypothetical protein n=1 Tax=Microcoleus sp. herbarium8 TaxID=3055436 RepID=UPI002FD617C6
MIGSIGRHAWKPQHHVKSDFIILSGLCILVASMSVATCDRVCDRTYREKAKIINIPVVD